MGTIIDRKFRILAVNPCKKGGVYTERDGVFLCAKDIALVPALDAYYTECKKLGCEHEHLNTIKLLIGRVEKFQRDNGTKIPDTDTDCEIERCIYGIGVDP